MTTDDDQPLEPTHEAAALAQALRAKTNSVPLGLLAPTAPIQSPEEQELQ